MGKIPKIVNNGYAYHYRGYTSSWDPREMSRLIYFCSHNRIFGWKENACTAKLHKVTYWSEFTDEPPHVEVIGKHNHPPLPQFKYPYPFKSMGDYKRYQLHIWDDE